jgi:ATP-dependent DNA helicase RecG
MSATPIPRSLALTLFGDVELSTLRERPPGRGLVHTYLAHDGWKDRWWKFVDEQIASGRQAIVVAPRIGGDADDDADDIEDVSSVTRVYEQLRDEVLPNRRVQLLHARMSSDDKRGTIQAFARGDIDVLVSTTVIEVGIDVPNATVMTILGAERYGLAQLHQLRGRIARGVHPGHVCVFTDGPQPPSEYERLRVFEKTLDGFALAEADFKLRGPGELFGKRQSGLPPLRVADLQRDLQILQVARLMAQEKLDQDPGLDHPDWSELRAQVVRRYGNQLDLGDVA